MSFISNVMLIGDQKKFMSMLVTLKCEVDPETTAPLDKLTPEAITALAAYVPSQGETRAVNHNQWFEY